MLGVGWPSERACTASMTHVANEDAMTTPTNPYGPPAICPPGMEGSQGRPAARRTKCRAKTPLRPRRINASMTPRCNRSLVSRGLGVEFELSKETSSKRRKSFARALTAILMVSAASMGSASSAGARPLEPSECRDLYTVTRSGSSVRVIAFTYDLKPTWGSTNYGTTKVWVDNSYKGGYGTSSSQGANFSFTTGTSKKRVIQLALVNRTGYQWCDGSYIR